MALLDAQTSGSPEWWLLRLGNRLNDQREWLEKLRAYYLGNHPLPDVHEKTREAYRAFQYKARTNYTGLVVETLRERLKVVGFRAGGGGTTTTDDATLRIWQANKMDAKSIIAHRQPLIYGRGYVTIGQKSTGADPDYDTPSPIIITTEDTRQVIHESHPADSGDIRCVLKNWFDEVDGCHHAVVYLPDSTHYFVSQHSDDNTAEQARWDPKHWDIDYSDESPDGYVDNTIGIVPVVPFINRPMGEAEEYGLGEFADVTDVQDRINGVILDRLVISRMQAYRQRWAKGIQLENEDGTAEEPFVPGADLLWAVEDPEAQFGDFAATDLTPLLRAVEADVRDLAAITRTPPHYLVGQIVNASGDALKAAETGLVSKALDRQVQFGEAWEQVMRVAAIYEGRDFPADAEVIWADPESRSMAELADASVKKAAAGVPWRQRMVDLGYTPPEIQRMEAERTTDALLAQPMVPPQPKAQPGQPQGQAPPSGEPVPA